MNLAPSNSKLRSSFNPVCISSMSLSSAEDQGFWEEYLQKVTDEDTRVITRWQKILETLLVYV